MSSWIWRMIPLEISRFNGFGNLEVGGGFFWGLGRN